MAAPFQTGTWTVFVVQVWLLDFGRPVLSLYLSDASSLSDLSMSDYVHMAYNYITALCLIQLQDKSSLPVMSRTLQQVLLISFVMGASIHMVADAVQHRLLRAGAKLHLTIQQQPMMQDVDDSVAASFHLLDFLDERVGHHLWYLALYSLFLLYFYSCFYPSSQQHNALHYQPSIVFYVLLFLSVFHEWYAVTEAQVFIQFAAMNLLMLLVLALRQQQGAKVDSNGKFILLRSVLTLLLIAVWVVVLWRDRGLREKYHESWLYVPEPWSYASLYLMNHTH